MSSRRVESRLMRLRRCVCNNGAEQPFVGASRKSPMVQGLDCKPKDGANPAGNLSEVFARSIRTAGAAPVLIPPHSARRRDLVWVTNVRVSRTFRRMLQKSFTFD